MVVHYIAVDPQAPLRWGSLLKLANTPLSFHSGDIFTCCGGVYTKRAIAGSHDKVHALGVEGRVDNLLAYLSEADP